MLRYRTTSLLCSYITLQCYVTWSQVIWRFFIKPLGPKQFFLLIFFSCVTRMAKTRRYCLITLQENCPRKNHVGGLYQMSCGRGSSIIFLPHPSVQLLIQCADHVRYEFSPFPPLSPQSCFALVFEQPFFHPFLCLPRAIPNFVRLRTVAFFASDPGYAGILLNVEKLGKMNERGK